MSMNNPELYMEEHAVTIRDGKEMMQYMKIDHWKDYGQNILDIGCGPGDLTWDILRPHIPQGTKIYGCDISQNMIEYARTKYPGIDFFILDIGAKKLSENLIGTFDHIFSSYCLQRIPDQRQAMKNINDLLKPGGDFFTFHLINTQLYDAIYKAASQQKWKKHTENLQAYADFGTNQYDNIEAQLKNILNDVGFEVSMCKVFRTEDFYPNLESVKKLLTSINPYIPKIPQDLQEELAEDTMQEMIKIVATQNCKHIMINSDLVVISATKKNLN